MPNAKIVKRDKAPPENMLNKLRYAALLTLEQLLQLCGVNTGHRNVRTDTVHHQRKQQEDKPATQVAELACLWLFELR